MPEVEYERRLPRFPSGSIDRSKTLAEQVIQVLDRRGWTQGAFFDQNGLCIAGALEEVLAVSLARDYHIMLLPLRLTESELTDLRAAAVALVEAIVTHVGACDGTLPTDLETMLSIVSGFNDDESTTYEDVQLVLKRAAVRLANDRDDRRPFVALGSIQRKACSSNREDSSPD